MTSPPQAAATRDDTATQALVNLRKLHAKSDTRRREFIDQTVAFLDASWPKEVDFVNLDLHDTEEYLVITEVLGDYGLALDKTHFSLQEYLLRSLGDPGLFDDGVLINSLGVYGWERSELYDPEVATRASQKQAKSRIEWESAVRQEHLAAVAFLREFLPSDIEALDFTRAASSIEPVAIITTTGRSEVPPDLTKIFVLVGRYLDLRTGAPESVLNEMTGLTRLSIR